MSKSASHAVSTLDLYHPSGWHRVLGLIRHVIQILTFNIQYIINAMWSCSERTSRPYTVHKLFSEEWNEGEKNKYSWIPKIGNNPKLTERRSNSGINVNARLNCHSCLISNELYSECLLFNANPAISSYIIWWCPLCTRFACDTGTHWLLR
jgi:hypothetical protein